MDVSIVIVNYNAKAVLRDCLRSIYDETQGIEFETIVVDNASTDGAAEMVRLEFPQVRLIANDENRGFAGGNNQGMAAASGEYFLILNPDTVILDGAVQKTFAYAEAHPRAAAIGCKVWSGDGTIQGTCSKFPSILNMTLMVAGLAAAFPENRLFGRMHMLWWDHNDTREVDTIAGCFMLVRLEAVDDVGAMDERYFMYAEETDWCWRMRRAGWKVVYFHEAEIVHLIGQSGKASSRDMGLERRKSMIAFFRKNRGVVAAWAANALFAIGDAVRIAGWRATAFATRLAGREGSDYLEKARGRSVTFRFHLLGRDADNPTKRKVTLGSALARGAKLAVSVVYFALVVSARRAIRAVTGRRRKDLIVLCYHGVRDWQRAGFAWQMDSLTRAGKAYSFAGAEEAADRNIAVTFDDAFRNLIKNALPETASRDIPCVIFAPTGSIGGLPGWTMREGATETDEPLMSSEDLVRLSGGLVTTGSHGVRHLRVGRLNDEEAQRELRDSKAALEACLGSSVELVAFPHGDWSKRTVALAKEAGYRRAFSIEPKTEDAAGDNFLLGRVLVEPDDWALEYLLKIRGGYEWLVPVRFVCKRVRRMMGHVPRTGMRQEARGRA